MKGFHHERAYSLAETIISIFILTYVFAITIALFHTGLRYGSQSIRVTRSGLFAETVMGDIRAWASNPANFDSDWSAYGVPVTHSDFPGLTALVDVVRDPADSATDRRWLHSPCTTAEEYYTVDQRRVLRNSCVWVQITVAGDASAKSLELVSLVGEPTRNLTPVVTVSRGSGPSDPIPFGESLEFSATLGDGGVTVEDPLWAWGVVPTRVGVSAPGNATLRDLVRDGRRSAIRNQIMRDLNPASPNHWVAVPGGVGVEAFTRYQGREFTGRAEAVMGP